MAKSAYSFMELLISIVILSIVMLATANFTSNTFQTTYTESLQIKNAGNTRFAAERIFEGINIADYIYPANTTFTLTVGGVNTSINTNNSVVYLLSDRTNSSPPKYFVKAFYLQDNASGTSDLYEFSSKTALAWSINSVPIASISQATGTASKIGTNILKANTTLSYILNYQNSTTDSVLEGQIASITTSNYYAIIKGINWAFVLKEPSSNKNLTIEELSNNVPRFVDQ